jgi:hypothetical protein
MSTTFVGGSGADGLAWNGITRHARGIAAAAFN